MILEIHKTALIIVMSAALVTAVPPPAKSQATARANLGLLANFCIVRCEVNSLKSLGDHTIVDDFVVSGRWHSARRRKKPGNVCKES